MSGTSMATPLTAGCVALIRQALQECGKKQPSAALIKALLVNGAVNYSSSSGLGFDYEQGFGRVDVDCSIAMIKQSTFIEGGSKLETTKYDVPDLCESPESPATARQWESPSIPIPSGRSSLVVTLAYPDPPHDLLQNNVNLVVRTGGFERHGNMGSGTDFDRTSEFLINLIRRTTSMLTPLADNVEKVIWDDVPGPTATIVVQANGFTKPDTKQAFAVAWSVRNL